MSRIILPSEVQGHSLKELWSLYARVERELTQSAVSSPERRNALASLENIRRVINSRAAQPRGPSPRF